MSKHTLKKDAKYDVIVVGGGLAGLSCAFYACKKGKKVLLLEKHKYLGGRTSSFMDMGMEVESGLHRYIGYYKELPKLLKKCGVKISDIVTWEDEVEILVKNGKITLGISPFFAPIKTIDSLIGNKEYLTLKDKISLLKFFAIGIKDYLLNNDIDDFSLEEYATLHKVTKNAQNLILEPFSSGLFFLPTNQYSAFAFFKMLMPAIPRFYKMRVGAFLGGMSEVLCNPIGDAIISMGGDIFLEEDVKSIIINNDSVIGVITNDNYAFYAPKTVIATPINAAKKILNNLNKETTLSDLFNIPMMSVTTLQIETSEPTFKKDLTVFGPSSNLVSFAEQSRSTFRNKNGRLSLILGKNQDFYHYTADDLLKIVIKELQMFGIDIQNKVIKCRKVFEKNEFYSLSPGSEKLRPNQQTNIKGLILAGDYTKTSSLCTMESAVISGKEAAKLCTKK